MSDKAWHRVAVACGVFIGACIGTGAGFAIGFVVQTLLG